MVALWGGGALSGRSQKAWFLSNTWHHPQLFLRFYHCIFRLCLFLNTFFQRCTRSKFWNKDAQWIRNDRKTNQPTKTNTELGEKKCVVEGMKSAKFLKIRKQRMKTIIYTILHLFIISWENKTKQQLLSLSTKTVMTLNNVGLARTA